VTDRDELGAGLGRAAAGALRAREMLPLAAECSVIVARGRDGAMVHLPVQRNLHRDGILAVTEVFAGNVACGAATRRRLLRPNPMAKGSDYVGVLCVEFFVLARRLRWWSTKSRHAPAQQRPLQPWTPATCRSSSCRCAPWPACR
jgi:5-(carboxyamino)imidazole ribonucleotide synthase